MAPVIKIFLVTVALSINVGSANGRAASDKAHVPSQEREQQRLLQRFWESVGRWVEAD